MRVLLISHEMTYTGAPNSLLSIARLLRSKGAAVTVQTLCSGKFSAEFEKIGFPVAAVSMDAYDFKALAGRYDFVIANTIFCGEFALKAQRYLLTYLYIREGENLKDIISACDLKDEYITLARHLICVSEYAGKFIKGNYAVRQLSVLHNFLYEEEYTEPSSNVVREGIVHFLIAATVEERKGIAVALDAVRLLPRSIRRRMLLHIAGRKPQWAKGFWEQLDLDAESVRYHGEIADKAEMDRLYDYVNVVVVPSFDESCSLAALEGAKHGKALIVTENTGAKYIVDGNGLIVGTGSADALAEAFESMVHCGQLEEMGRRSFDNFLRTSTKEVYYKSFVKVIGTVENRNSENRILSEQEINICFIADDDYAVPTSAAIASLCCHTDKDCNIFVVMPLKSSYQAKRYLSENPFEYKNVTIQVIEADCSELEHLHRGGSEQYLVATAAALLKFKLAELFPELDKILYLDGDIIVRDDISALYYDYDPGENYVAAVRDLPQVLYEKQQLGEEIGGRDYFNSGVMLLNLKKMRADNIKERLIETKRNCADQSLMDQNVFNIVFKGAVLQLPFVYNACYINLVESRDRYDITELNRLYHTEYTDVYEILPDIKIMHFSSKLKPWYFYDVPLADEWLYYYRKSSMRDVRLQRTFHTERNVDVKKYRNRVRELSEAGRRGFSKVIPIAFAGNEEYLYYASVTIQSIYENSNSEYLYDVNILVDETVSENMRKKLASLKYRNLKITLWDVRNAFQGIYLYSVGHYSRQMYYRWLIPEVLSGYDKVLYLDCDIVVNADVARLYEIPLGNHYIAAADNFLRDNLIHHVRNRLGLSLKEYYNSGVLVMNCRKWIEDHLKNRCIEALKSYDKLACPDQDILNVVCRGKIVRLEDRWNYQWHHRFPDARTGSFTLDYKERYDRLSGGIPYVIHFTSWVKPWNSPDRVFAEFFWKYCRDSMFYEAILFRNVLNAEAGQKQVSGNASKKKTGTADVIELSREEIRIRNEIYETEKSITYRLSRMISFVPRKMKKYDYSPIPPEGAGASAVQARLDEIRSARSYRLAEKILKLPKKILGKK